MELIYLLLIGLLSFALVYILIQARVSSIIEKKLNDYYKSQIQADMQEFYREMESHAAILDSRVGRFKKLIERQEENLRAWEKIYQTLKSTKKGKEINLLLKDFKDLKDEFQELKQAQAPLPGAAPSSLATRAKPETPALKTQKASAKPASSGKSAPKAPSAPSTRSAPAQASPKQPAQEPSTHLPDDLYDDLIDSMQSSYKPERANTPEAPAPKSVQQQPVEPAPSSGKNVFTTILSSIGKKVMPLLEKEPSQTPAPPSEPAQAFGSMLTQNFNTSREQRAPQGQKIQKSSSLREPGTLESSPTPPGEELFEKKTAPPLKSRATQKSSPPASPEKQAIVPDETTESVPPHSLEKKIDPESLIDLIERLRGPAGRPEALRNLISCGFNIPQISEISGIPLSDLEMTRSIYNIPEAPQPGKSST